MSSFICFFVYSVFFILGVMKFLECLLTCLLTISGHISIKFSVITCRIYSLRVFLWASLGSLSFIFVLLESGIGYPFSSFPSESCIKLFWGVDWFPSHLLHPIVPLVLDRLVCCFSHLFSSSCFNFVL
jgi:hypothetical protein